MQSVCVEKHGTSASLCSLLQLEYSTSARRNYSSDWKRRSKSRHHGQTQPTYRGQRYHGGQHCLTKPLFHDTEMYNCPFYLLHSLTLPTEALPLARDNSGFADSLDASSQSRNMARAFDEHQGGQAVRRE